MVGRPSGPIEDPTPLTGARIDVGARIRWLLRVHRTAAGATLDDVAAGLRERGLRTSRTALSTIERSGDRSGEVVDGYERVLGLCTGHLRAPVDIVCRTFDYVPVDVRPALLPAELAQVDAVLDLAHDGDALSGPSWFRLARALGPEGLGWLPSQMTRRLSVQLLDELVRSVGIAYLTRYEAVARIRCGRYADHVEDAARAMVLDLGSQSVALTAMSAVAEQPTERLLHWTAALLDDPAPWRCRAAALALENMRAVGGLPDDAWLAVVPHLVAGLRDARGDVERGVALTVLYKNLPRRLRAEVAAAGGDALLHPVPAPASWHSDETNEHLAQCRALVTEACRAAGLPDQPMAARLVFEAVHDFRAARSVTSGFLLMASPLITGVRRGLMRLAVEGDADTRPGAVRALQLTQVAGGDDDIRAWYATHRDALGPAAMLVAGNAGADLPPDVVDVARRGDSTGMRAVEAMGLVGHPALPALVDDAGAPADVRHAAAWWLARGGRVVH